MRKPLHTALNELRQKQKSTFAFNVQNFYQLEACKITAEKLKLPVIIQFSERFLRFLEDKYSVKFIMENFKSDYTYFHLDHCIDIDFIKFCIEAGFDSVMYDGSAFLIDENIKNSLIVKEHAEKFNCLVEGELGKVSGVEDGFGEEGSSYAEIQEIIRYVEETKIDLMALGIGNAHGFYENLEGIDLSILEEASKKLHPEQLFVLHGGTGLPKEVIKEAISYGVVKINISTQLKKETIDILKEFATNNSLYNEISYHTKMVEGLSNFFEQYLLEYTV
ncbi:fructose-bisphosphate aldolase, class II [Maribacter sedimenticola]|uniref:Fructose-bisphosphate aldolase, class II n=1 Tax=Maribacter sedimenticola TaxID=228956 RepID=A0ABY1SBY2_9FLAO|nr:class II fructose-bisphosphate aldolase [Maribacter sedimenticola]SNR24503.1 fructose-bisphosphate aldolase, class II [Maribacter sedimenticola]